MHEQPGHYPGRPRPAGTYDYLSLVGVRPDDIDREFMDNLLSLSTVDLAEIQEAFYMLKNLSSCTRICTQECIQVRTTKYDIE